MGYCTMIVFTYKTLIMLQYAYEYVSETDLVNEIDIMDINQMIMTQLLSACWLVNHDFNVCGIK